ncbi:MAG: GxxExxY protein [Cyclobacteriaceae bacterium]
MTALTKSYLNELTYEIVGAAIEVHKALGPGLLESVYHKCLKQEFASRQLSFFSEYNVPVQYKGLEIEAELRCDFVVEDSIVVELKAVDAVAPVHEAQLLTYMKLLEKPKGILINFNCANLFKEGQRTYVNELFRELPD